MKKVMMSLLKGIGLTTAVALLAVGCHSGGSSGVPAKSTPTAASRGVITGFGSVFVNGVEYDSAAATVSMNGVAGAETDLQVGMVVTVSGSIASSGLTGTAATIEYADSLEGPVSAVFIASSGTFQVMGQTVKVDASTNFKNAAGAAQLALNDMVEVSGFSDVNGVILATRVEKKSMAFAAGSTVVEVKGPVSGLAGGVFSINALSVNATGLTLPAGLANGNLVEAKGTLAAAAGPMTAAKVEVIPAFTAADGVHVELEGVVTDYVSLSSFKVNGVPVDGTALGSVTIANNMKVEVEGTMQNGILVAAKCEVEQESNILLEGDVVSVGTGTLVLLGKSAEVTTTTQYQDSSAAAVRLFNFSNIAVNDHIVLIGYQGAKGIVATSIERTAASTAAAMKGIVSAATATTSVTIQGTALNTSSAAFRDINGAAMLAADFFTAITPGTTVVKVKWSVFTATSAPVNEAEIESTP